MQLVEKSPVVRSMLLSATSLSKEELAISCIKRIGPFSEDGFPDIPNEHDSGLKQENESVSLADLPKTPLPQAEVAIDMSANLQETSSLEFQQQTAVLGEHTLCTIIELQETASITGDQLDDISEGDFHGSSKNVSELPVEANNFENVVSNIETSEPTVHKANPDSGKVHVESLTNLSSGLVCPLPDNDSDVPYELTISEITATNSSDGNASNHGSPTDSIPAINAALISDNKHSENDWPSCSPIENIADFRENDVMLQTNSDSDDALFKDKSQNLLPSQSDDPNDSEKKDSISGEVATEGTASIPIAKEEEMENVVIETVKLLSPEIQDSLNIVECDQNVASLQNEGDKQDKIDNPPIEQVFESLEASATSNIAADSISISSRASSSLSPAKECIEEEEATVTLAVECTLPTYWIASKVAVIGDVDTISLSSQSSIFDGLTCFEFAAFDPQSLIQGQECTDTGPLNVWVSSIKEHLEEQRTFLFAFCLIIYIL